MKSVKILSKELGVSKQTIFNNIKRLNIETIKQENTSFIKENTDIEKIIQRVNENKKKYGFDTYYRLEDVEFELVSVLKRFKAMLLQKDESVEAMQGYLMQSIKAELEEIHALNMRRQNISKYNIFNQ